RLRERDAVADSGRPEPLTAQDRLHHVLAIGPIDTPHGVQDIHQLAGGLLLGAGAQVGDDRFGYDEVGELHPSPLVAWVSTRFEMPKTTDFGTPLYSNQNPLKRRRKPSHYPSRNQRPWLSPNRRVPGRTGLSGEATLLRPEYGARGVLRLRRPARR